MVVSNSTRPSYVAVIDVLGFREYVRQKPIDEAGAILEELQAASRALNVSSLQFSDTLLLYTEGTDPGKLTDIVKAAVRLIANFAHGHIFLRCAITAGEFWSANGIFVGKAMIRAYDLEEDQDWMGGIIDPLLLEGAEPIIQQEIGRLEKEGLLAWYEAPIKGGSAGPIMCLGWPRNYQGEVSPMALVDSSSWSIMRKDHNTGLFLDMYRRNPKWANLMPV